jgi:hypothetical protein
MRMSTMFGLAFGAASVLTTETTDANVINT